MSTTTVPNRLAECKQSLTNIYNRIKNLFTKVIPDDILSILPGVITFVQGIQSFVENATVDTIVTQLFPVIGSEVLAKIEAVLDTVIADLNIVLTAEMNASVTSKMQGIADHIATQPAGVQQAYLHALSTGLTRAVSGDKTVTDTELSAIVAFHTNDLAHAASKTA